MKDLGNAIDIILPSIKHAKLEGVYFNRPDLLEMVASSYFLEDDTITSEKRNAYAVCKVYMKRLTITGCLTVETND